MQIADFVSHSKTDMYVNGVIFSFVYCKAKGIEKTVIFQYQKHLFVPTPFFKWSLGSSRWVHINILFVLELFQLNYETIGKVSIH